MLKHTEWLLKQSVFVINDNDLLFSLDDEKIEIDSETQKELVEKRKEAERELASETKKKPVSKTDKKRKNWLYRNTPYNKGAFKVQIDFPVEYPYKPPKITIKTKIYHPNVDEKGQICMPIITPENRKPATKIEHLLILLLH